jgi:hypothetical protein
LVALHVAAMVTRGVRVSADSSRNGSGSISAGEKGALPLGVIVFTAVDRPEDTVLPRLIALGADPSLVFFLKPEIVKDLYDEETEEESTVVRPFRLSQDMEELQSCIDISYGTLRRAFKILGCKATKVKNQWFWSLPEHPESVCEEKRNELIGAPDGQSCAITRESMPIWLKIDNEEEAAAAEANQASEPTSEPGE